MLDYAAARRNMVDCQLRTFDVTDRAVLAAMEMVRRELFMPPGRGGLAYLDQNVSLSADGHGGPWMLQPMVVGRLVQALSLDAGDPVLEIGCGLGYVSAVMAQLGANVVALEAEAELAAAARARIAEAGLAERVSVQVGRLEKGAPDRAPYEAIFINGAVEHVPETLFAQLSDGGRLVCLQEDRGAGRAMLYVRGEGAATGSKALFNATAPVLGAFRVPPTFSF